MNWSLVETEALARKAARGGGYSWGQAEDAGAAVRWLEARGLPGAAALAALLETPVDARSCPIVQGTYLCDAGVSPAPATLADLRAPLLLVPFLAWCAGPGGGWLDAGIGPVRFTIGPDGVWRQGAQNVPMRATVQLSAAQRPDAAALGVVTRARCDSGVMAVLDGFAARTYAPATEASRLAGAGAGLSDND